MSVNGTPEELAKVALRHLQDLRVVSQWVVPLPEAGQGILGGEDLSFLGTGCKLNTQYKSL